MLVLQRKKNDIVMIGPDIEVMITEIKGDTVRIGLKAPPSVVILRKEVYEAIQKQNLAATSLEASSLEKIDAWFSKK